MSEAAPIETGANGDWQKEGYTLDHAGSVDYEGADDGQAEQFFTEHPELRPHIFVAHAPDGEPAADIRIGPTKDNRNIYVYDANVEEPHRRKGLASALYKMAEEYFGKKLLPGVSGLSEDSKALWQQPGRPFGEPAAAAVTAGMLDFPRKKLPSEIWLYEDDKPLPRLQPKLRATILSEGRYRLKKFGARIIGAMLYGGAATYQYHEGGDIDVSLYIDWDDFKGDEEILQDAFKSVEIPWGKYELHLFVKPSTQTEQVEVADAYYDVLHDDWVLPPLVLPRDFDPEVFFKPMVEMAEQKAQRMDQLMGEVGREWTRLKKALRAIKEGARDEHVVREKAYMTQQVLLDKIDVLCEEFVAIWKGRKKLHDQLRKRYINDRNIGRFERFQFPEVCWKYLDEMGYVEFLKVLAKAQEAGVIKNLLDRAIPEGESDEPVGD